jgi:predicted phage-related endonuclease
MVYNIYRKRLRDPSKNYNPKGEYKMSQNEMITKIEQLKEWESILEEAQAEVEALRDCIKTEMLEQETEELQVGTYIVRWTSVLSNRFDSTAFKKQYAELYKSYTKQVASKRFSIA